MADERILILLGLLRSQSQHGYQINEFIERNLSRVTDMKKPTAYALLDRLEQSGDIAVRIEQEGNRPSRKVYSITDQGEGHFMELLRQNLAEASPLILVGDAGFMFLEVLPLSEIVDLLRRRLASIEAQIAELVLVPSHGPRSGVDLAIEHQLMLLRTDVGWLHSVIERFEQQAE